MTADDFRALALRIPNAIESSHMQHPDFRLAGRIFASLGIPDEGWAMVKLTPEQQRALLAQAPGVFRPCSGAWGRQGCTNVHLATAERDMLQVALQAAAENVASKPAKNKTAAAGSMRTTAGRKRNAIAASAVRRDGVDSRGR